jgi:ketosteroid isomerase-like protein
MHTQIAKFTHSVLPLVTAALLSPLFTGCATHDATLPNDLTTALASAFTRGDVAACTDLYRDDAVILSDNTPSVHGKQAIHRFFEDQVAREILLSTDPAVSVVQGDLAMDQGTYRIRNVNRGVDVEYGEYLNVWRFENGQWRVFRSMFNTKVSPKVAVSVTPDTEDDPASPHKS